jgi:nitrogen fixation NifU-like protein
MSELADLYQEIILDHNKRPRNYREMPECTCQAEGLNPLCGDEVKVFLRMEEGKLSDVAFQGQGCAISRASASMMTQKIKGKAREEATKMATVFRGIVTGKDRQLAEEEELGELILLEGVQHFPQRVKCAMLSWRALEQALNEKAGTVSTEELGD